MTDYEEFMKYLQEKGGDEWTQVQWVFKNFPGVNQKTIDRLAFNHRIEVQKVPDKGHCIRLTAKGRAKQEKKTAPVKETVIGIVLMVLLVIVVKCAT